MPGKPPGSFETRGRNPACPHPPVAAFPTDPGGWRSRCAPAARDVQDCAVLPPNRLNRENRLRRIAHNERGAVGSTPDTSRIDRNLVFVRHPPYTSTPDFTHHPRESTPGTTGLHRPTSSSFEKTTYPELTRTEVPLRRVRMNSNRLALLLRTMVRMSHNGGPDEIGSGSDGSRGRRG